MAAEYAKEVLSVIPPAEKAKSYTAVEETMRDANGQCSCCTCRRCINADSSCECVVKPMYCIPFLEKMRRAGFATAASASEVRLREDVNRWAGWDGQDAGCAAARVWSQRRVARVVHLLGVCGEHGKLRAGVRRTPVV